MAERDVESVASVSEFVAKPGRSLTPSRRVDRSGSRSPVRASGPKHAELSVEHERSGAAEEVELQLRSSNVGEDSDDVDDSIV